MFFLDKVSEERNFSEFLVKMFKLTVTEGNLRPIYVAANLFGLFAHLFGFNKTLKSSFFLFSLLVFYIDRSVLLIFHK